MDTQNRYNKQGRDMIWTYQHIEYKLRDLPNDAILEYINSEKKPQFSKHEINIWILIFKDELQFRRNDKINKIIRNNT